MTDYMSERPQRNPFMSDANSGQTSVRTVPIINAPSSGDPMEVTSPGHSMGPPSRTNDEHENNGIYNNMGLGEHTNGGLSAAEAGAAGGPQQPKVVQTAFIHKLYNMLEDQSIQSLICWTQANDSFIMSPTSDFSKVLSQYFKHTNISSFVRQLNMYGFHKVSDVFHTASPDTPMWEFKHGGGSFKRGDLIGLREIKRRASRHALVHRDSYSAPKAPISQPGTPGEPIHAVQDSQENRLTQLEQIMYDVHARLQRSEDNSQFLHVRNQVVMDALSQTLQLNYDMSKMLQLVTPPQDNQLHRDISHLQGEVQRQVEMIRTINDPPQAESAGWASRPYLASLSLDNPPVSPRHMPQDDPRRAPPAPPMTAPQRNGYHKPTVPSHLSITPRRYGSIGGATSQPSPSSLRSQAPLPPPVPHPLHHVSSPPMGRRHTSADIRIPNPNWQGNQHQSPFASGNSSAAYPSSPRRGSVINEEQHIRDSFSNYSLSSATQIRSDRIDGSGPPTPPFTNGGSSMDHLNQFSFAPRDRAQPPGAGMFNDSSGPPTRRGSMAHILNPAETAERAEHDEEAREEDRKRKRVQ